MANGSRIGIIDYGVGNLRSVQKALQRFGVDAHILGQPDQASDADKLILPGVGAFADGMELLGQRGWTPVVKDWVSSGRKLLGICLGMQLLFETSEEDAPSKDELVPGLGIIPGNVVRFRGDAPAKPQAAGARLKVPHMGWNTLEWSRPDPLLDGLEQGSAVYFVHSYYCRPSDNGSAPGSVTSATCDYGGRFCATLWRDNIWATQFHPEKSQRVGLKILENFAKL